MWRRRVGVLLEVARPVGSLRSPPPRRFVAGRLASLPPPPLLLAPPRLCTTLEQVRKIQVVQPNGVIQRYWVSRRVVVAPSPVVALSLREALPLGVRGSFRCSCCRFGLVLPLFTDGAQGGVLSAIIPALLPTVGAPARGCFC